MIHIGLAGWGDHPDLYEGIVGKEKLQIYSTYFPVVEVDSSFYAVQPTKNFEKWMRETPSGFSFIVKAYQGMTGHLRGEQRYFKSLGEMFDAFLLSIEPVIAGGKLTAVLFQYPPWFHCSKENVEVLRYANSKMGSIPVALEFRHQSWFADTMKDRTLAFMEKEGWIHSICDEPQAGESSIPIVLKPTHEYKTVVRFHGRNVQGWNNNGAKNWREVRYLYRYSQQELMEWKDRLELLQKQSQNVYVIFNNNSGGDAADNAKQLIDLLGIKRMGVEPMPRQLDLF